MNRLLRIIDALDDRLNPIVVKELRQAVLSRFVIFMLLGFLLLNIVVLLGGVVGREIDMGESAGRGIFLALDIVLVIACIGFLPIYTAVRLAAEHSDANVDLLFITTIRAGSIVRGKFAAAMLLALVVFGACAPFMTFTYLLRGIDLPTIFFVLGINLLATADAVLLALLLAALPAGRVLRAFLGLGFLGILGTICTSVIGMSTAIVRFGIFVESDSADFWPAVATFAGLNLAGAGFLYFVAVAALSPKSSNRNMPVRIYLTIVWLATLAVGALWIAHLSSFGRSAREDVVAVWTISSTVMLCLLLFIAVSEREGFNVRVRRYIPRSSLLRALSLPFFTGGSGGIIWCLILGVATFVIAGLWQDGFLFGGRTSPSGYTRGPERAVSAMFCLWVYAYCYALTGAWLRRMLFPKARTDYNGVTGLILVAFGCFLPVLIRFFSAAPRWTPAAERGLWYIGNPFASLFLPAEASGPAEIFAVVWAILITLGTLPWLIREVSLFQPLPVRTSPPPPPPAAASAHES